MAVPCDACGKPVHEQVVKCLHCGERTGVAVDSVAAAMVSVRDEVFIPPPATPPPRYGMTDVQSFDHESGILEDAADLVTAVVDIATRSSHGRRDDTPIPRATARPPRKPDR